MAAVLASRHMSAERRRVAALDRRHGLELAEARVPRPGLAPGRTPGAEDIRDLQSFPGHDAAGSGGRQGSRAELLQRALDRAQGGAGDTGVVRGGVELLVAQQHLDHADVDFLLQEMGGEGGCPGRC